MGGPSERKRAMKAVHAAAAYHEPSAVADKAHMKAALNELGDLPTLSRSWSSGSIARLSAVKDDLTVLRSIWFKRLSGGDHAQRLESFYGPQAHACKCASRPPVCYMERTCNLHLA